MNVLFARWVFGRTGGMRHRMLSWPLALLVVVALHAGSAWVLFTGLTFNNAPEVYFSPGSPASVLREELRRDFPVDEALTVLFVGDDLYGADFLRRLQGLADRLEQHPLVDRVLTVTTFERIAGRSDGFAVERLVDVERLPRRDPAAVRARVMADRFAPGALASRDGRALAMAVRPKLLDESAQRLQLKVAVAAAINDAGLRPYYAGDAGPVSLDVAQLASILRDTQWLVPLTVAIGLALLFWVVGRLRPVVIGGLAMSTVVAPMIAGVVLAGQPYTMATAILPSLFAAYTVVTLMHFYAGVQRGQRATADRSHAIDHALDETRHPSLFNVVTTAAGLLSLVLVPIPPIQTFGVAGAIGTAMVFLTVFVLVPPFLRHWDRRPWPQQGSNLGRLGTLARRMAVASMRWPKTVVAALVVAMVALAPLALKVQVETDLLAFFSPQHAINVDTRRIEQSLMGVTTLEISLRGESPDTFQRVATLREVKQLQQWLEALPEVDRAVSMADLVEEMHWAMNRERPAFRTLPGNDRLLRQYLLIYDGDDLYELVNRDFDHARIVVNLNVHGTQAISRTIGRIRDRLAQSPIASVKADIGGHGRMLSDQVDLLVDGQIHSFVGAFGQIFLLMTLLWRSPKAAALCMLPNLAPLFFIFVLMGATGIHLDLATVMIASVVLGITVDDTIHLYHGYRRRMLAGVSPLWAIARSYESAGRAVLATSVVLIAQFALLTTSDFIPTANFGLMTAVGLLAGLAFEMLLPALLVLVNYPRPSRARTRRRKPASRSTDTAHHDSRAASTSATTSMPRDAVTRRVLVCHGDDCKQRGAAAVWRRMRAEQRGLAERDRGVRLQVAKTTCLGACDFAPVAQVFPEGTYYGRLDGTAMDRIIDEHLLNGRPVGALALPESAVTPPQD